MSLAFFIGAANTSLGIAWRPPRFRPIEGIERFGESLVQTIRISPNGNRCHA